MGGRRLRIEPSRVKSCELQASKANGVTRQRGDTTGPPLPMPTLSTMGNYSPFAKFPVDWLPMGNFHMTGGYLGMNPMFSSTLPTCTAILSSLPADGSATRLAIFNKVKRFGFIHSIELVGPGEWNPALDSANSSFSFKGLRAIVLFDNPSAVDRACLALVHFMLGSS